MKELILAKKANSARQKDYRTYLVINTIGYLGMGVHLALIPLFYWLGIEFLSFINIFSFLIWVIAWKINKNGQHDMAIGLMVCEVVLHTLSVVPIMGWHAGFQYYLIGTLPFSLFSTKFNGRLIVLASIGLCLRFTSLDAFTHDTIQTLIPPAYIKISIIRTLLFAAQVTPAFCAY